MAFFVNILRFLRKVETVLIVQAQVEETGQARHLKSLYLSKDNLKALIER
jgi:hypothetical protein